MKTNITRRRLMEIAGLVEEIKPNTTYVVYYTTDIDQAIQDNTWTEVQGQPQYVAEEIESLNADADFENTEWPGANTNSAIKALFRKNTRALVRGDEKASELGSEGIMDDIDQGDGSFKVPIGLKDGKEVPIITALVGTDKMMAELGIS